MVTATSGSTFTDARRAAPTPTTTPRSGRRSSATTTPTSTPPSRPPARSVGLMGVGVTPVEVELAERLCDAVPSLEKVLLTATGSEATFHALRLARTVDGAPPHVKFQGCYHGWHDSVAMNVISPRRARRHEGSALAGDPPRGPRRDDRLPASTTPTRSSARSTDARRRRDHPRADPAQHRRGAAAARLPRAAARARDEARHGARLRRGDHRLPARRSAATRRSPASRPT